MVKPDSNAWGIGIDSSDDVYVTGGGAPNTAVQKFTNNGILITSWDSTGLGDSEFVFNLENLPKWASAAFQSIKEQGKTKDQQSITQWNGFGSLCYSTVWNGSVRLTAGSKEWYWKWSDAYNISDTR